jgi:hypothetical protein
VFVFLQRLWLALILRIIRIIIINLAGALPSSHRI